MFAFKHLHVVIFGQYHPVIHTIVYNRKLYYQLWITNEHQPGRVSNEFKGVFTRGDQCQVILDNRSCMDMRHLSHTTPVSNAFMERLEVYGIKASQMHNDDTDTIEQELGDPLSDWVLYKPTNVAVFLMNGVIPALQERLTPPKPLTDKTDPRLS